MELCGRKEPMLDKRVSASSSLEIHYDSILEDISKVIDTAGKSAARSVNCIMTAAYWLIGRRIVELEQKGEARAEYGEELIERLAADLIARYGRGFSVRNVWQMKAFYLAWPLPQTVYAQSEGLEIPQTVSAESVLSSIVQSFPLPWSAYVRLLSVKNENAGRFYEAEALLRLSRHWHDILVGRVSSL